MPNKQNDFDFEIAQIKKKKFLLRWVFVKFRPNFNQCVKDLKHNIVLLLAQKT